MASYHAIAAICQAILRLLEDAAKGDPQRPEFSAAEFELFGPSDFQKSMSGMGVGLYLYRVAANTSRRNLPPRVGQDGRRYRSPLPLDLHFLLTPWAQAADTQHRLLGWAMRVLDDTPILPVGLLNGDESSPGPPPFRSDETVELVFDPLSIQDMASLWGITKPWVQPGVTYTARLVAIDSDVGLSEAELVQTREFGLGRPMERLQDGRSP